MKKLSQLVAVFLLIIGLLGSSVALQAFAAVHTLQFVETPAIALYSSESVFATSLVVTPVPVDLDDNVLTMSSFGSSPTLTVDPGILGAEEIESFTSITNNGNNTATIGGVTRDLQSQYPYGTNGTGQSHGAGATVVFSNNPQLYNRLASWENDGFVTGSWVYVTQPTYLTTQTFTNPLALASVGYVNGVAIQGAATSTYTFMGISQLANFGQVGTGLASSTAGAPLVIENKFASSTYNGSTVFQGEIPALRVTKDIDPNFIATSTGNNYVWGGNQTFNAGFLSNASSTLNATTSIAASSITNNALKLNNVPYSFPSTQGGVSTALMNSGTGVLSWSTPISPKYSIVNASGPSASGGAGTYATSTILGIPAGTLSASSTIMVIGNASCGNTGGSATCSWFLRDTVTGQTIASCGVTNSGIASAQATDINIVATNQSSLSAQASVTTCNTAFTTAGNFGQTLTSSINTANAVNLVMVSEISSSAGGTGPALLSNYSIVVNP